MRPLSEAPPNLFRDPQKKPDWAQLTRWGGDRAAILFEDLRRCVSKIEGLQEELYYGGPEWGWVPRYRLGNEVLFVAHIFPGMLEATLYLEESLCGKLLKSPAVSAHMKNAIRAAPVLHREAAVRVRLRNASLVRSFAKLVLEKSQFASGQI